MAKYNGDKLAVVVNGVPIAGTRSFTLTINQTNFDSSSKDSAGWNEVLPGNRDWNVSFDGLFDPSGIMQAEEIFDLIDGRTAVTLEIAVIEGSGLKFTGTAYANNLTLGAPSGEAVTLSGGFDGTGTLVKGSVTAS